MASQVQAAHGQSDRLPEDARECPMEKNDLNETPSALKKTGAGLNEPDASESDPTDQQLAAIDLLAQGAALQAVALTLKIDPKTLYRWRQRPRFAALLRQRREELWSDATHRLRGLAHACISELDEQLHDVYDRSRFRAATALLKMIDLKKAAAELED